MNHSQNKKTYHVFDFANFNERGLAKFLTELKRSGSEVSGVTATNRAAKKDGLLTKRVELFFMNGQRALIVIGDQGDVVSMKVNGKAYPVDAKSLKALAGTLHDLFKRGQKAFDDSLAKKLKKIETDKPNNRPASRSQATRIAEIDELIEKARKDLEIAKAALSEAQGKRNGLKVDIDGIKNRIVAVNNEIKTLSNELAKLEVTA